MGLLPGLLGGSGMGLAWRSGLPTLNLDLSATTFTAKMAKRTGDLFAAAPIVQGSQDGTAYDEVKFSRGTQISGNFYSNIDTNQGSIVFWVTPEWDGDDGKTHQFFRADGNFYIEKNASNQLSVRLVGTHTVDISSWTAGTTYLVVIRWDVDGVLDATNYIDISINDSSSFGHSSSFSSTAPSASAHIGSAGTASAADAIIEGFTVYRRPLFDGTYGIDAGNGDEINLIYASGSGKDPCEITGSWDVVFCAPTNASTGELSTGTTAAWSHPHSSNVLTDWHAITTYGSSAWSTVGTPATAPADLAAADKIYAGGYDWTAGAVTGDGDGIDQSLTSLTAGQNYVLRCVAHVDDANDYRVKIYDDTNSAEIVSFETGASSTRAAPGVALFAFELPTNARNGAASDCTAITVSVEATANDQQVYLHQIELLENLIDNPSMETGSGNPWIPDGWTNNGLDAGESAQEVTIVHSGGSSFKMVSGSSSEHIYRSVIAATGDFLGTGLAAYNPESMNFGYNDPNQGVLQVGAGAPQVNDNTSTWKRYHAVVREKTGSNVTWKGGALTRDSYLDDYYAFVLTAVTLTVTPATEANSTEVFDGGSGVERTWLRVDGRDTLTQPVANITATRGKVRFRWVPKRVGAAQLDMAELTPRIMSFGVDGANRLLLYQTTSTVISLYVAMQGATANNTWTFGGDIQPGVEYLVEVEYQANGQATMKLDGVTKLTTTGLGPGFSSLPANIYIGSDYSGQWQSDAWFAAP